MGIISLYKNNMTSNDKMYNNRAEMFLNQVKDAVDKIQELMRDDQLDITYEQDDYMEEVLRLELYLDSALKMAKFVQLKRQMMVVTDSSCMLEVSNDTHYRSLSDEFASQYEEYSRVMIEGISKGVNPSPHLLESTQTPPDFGLTIHKSQTSSATSPSLILLNPTRQCMGIDIDDSYGSRPKFISL